MNDDDRNDTGAMQVDVELVRQLAELLDDTQLTEIEVEDGERRIRVARKAARRAGRALRAGARRRAAAPRRCDPAGRGRRVRPPRSAPSAVKSPMVGTVYLAAEPEREAVRRRSARRSRRATRC